VSGAAQSTGETVAFLGLGVMGEPMAGHLARARHRVTVYNRTRSKAEALAARLGASVAATPRDAASGAAFVFTCVGNDDDVRAVVLGEHGALAGMSAGSVLVDHTTASAELARELYACCKRAGVGFLDAPVSGGQVGAQNGTLTIMVGGDEDDFARAEPVLLAYARKVARLGPAGSGQLTKMVNQICIAGLVEALAEGLHFAERVGLDPHAVVDVISKGAAQSWQMDQRHATMIEGRFDFGFAVDWMRKDLAMALGEAERHGLELPATQLVDALYAEVQAIGGGRLDTSSLLLRLREKTNAPKRA
jgi:3-hydroxyisobutyrate dehydrogenase-like beta-hydroxyacid dehydrogenase